MKRLLKLVITEKKVLLCLHWDFSAVAAQTLTKSVKNDMEKTLCLIVFTDKAIILAIRQNGHTQEECVFVIALCAICAPGQWLQHLRECHETVKKENRRHKGAYVPTNEALGNCTLQFSDRPQT